MGKKKTDKEQRQRDMALIRIALRHDLDSIELEEIVRSAGLDPETADLAEIQQAVAKKRPALPPWFCL